MQFTVNRDIFSEAVAFAAKLLPQRPTQPILTGVLIEAADNTLTISSFDYEISAQNSVDANVTNPGRALVSGRLLGEIAQRLPQSDVEVSLSDTTVLIRCGSATFNLPAMPLEQYPQIPQVNSISGTVPADSFAAAVVQVSLAAAKDDVTRMLNGIKLDVTQNSLSFIATDRFRIAQRHIDWEHSDEEQQLTAVVPTRVLVEVGKTFAGEGTIQITILNNDERALIAFVGGRKRVTSLLIDGKYPPVERLLPEQIDNYAVINTAELVEAVGRVGLVLDRDAPLRFSFTEGKLTLEAAGAEHTQARETIDTHMIGEDIVVALKPQFLLDGARSTNGEFVRIGFTQIENKSKPGPVLVTRHRAKDDTDTQDFRYLLQPNLLLQ